MDKDERGTRTFSKEEYLELDRSAPEGIRLEYFDGYIYLAGKVFDPASGWDAARDVAGASPNHGKIKNNVETLLSLKLRDRDCDVFSSDLQLKIAPSGRYVYPDVLVACSPEYAGNMLTNPDLVIEVLSERTAEHDLGHKMDAYAALGSIQEYWFISQSDVRIIQCFRTEEGWELRHHTDLEATIRCDALDIGIPVREVYRRVF